ncbi:arsenic resistance N-acetyltransferase ArsN2 [Pseudomarimonas salicorniae]|uniref:Arsenic resistance N-acetyltransferase ArsN2 n=1 Tax=Pseudomarimonas salicorniae TaxID=2933270 RepID=A0ABT0GIA4_9GAMM|nr:arsenic resistance N-acetyltransferase ArsN2 [Lysobacter sp. CAU 1642]
MLDLLQRAGLPTADLGEGGVDFLVADQDGRALGVIGLQRFEGVGLLRSLVVDGDHRGRRLGVALVAELEARARAAGTLDLVLLTETAEAFFGRRGYARIERAAAPAVLQQTAEFRALCPASAVCMRKRL